MTDRDKLREVAERTAAQQRDKMVEGGERYDVAARKAERLVQEAAENVDRRRNR